MRFRRDEILPTLMLAAFCVCLFLFWSGAITLVHK